MDLINALAMAFNDQEGTAGIYSISVDGLICNITWVKHKGVLVAYKNHGEDTILLTRPKTIPTLLSFGLKASNGKLELKDFLNIRLTWT